MNRQPANPARARPGPEACRVRSAASIGLRRLRLAVADAGRYSSEGSSAAISSIVQRPGLEIPWDRVQPLIRAIVPPKV
jgi:hypothetical protein